MSHHTEFHALGQATSQPGWVNDFNRRRLRYGQPPLTYDPVRPWKGLTLEEHLRVLKSGGFSAVDNGMPTLEQAYQLNELSADMLALKRDMASHYERLSEMQTLLL
jgi:hypothetical protein